MAPYLQWHFDQVANAVYSKECSLRWAMDRQYPYLSIRMPKTGRFEDEEMDIGAILLATIGR